MPQMTTSQPPAKKLLFEPPARLINEEALYDKLNQAITPETFQELIGSNFLVSMAAFDRRLERDMYEGVLVSSFNLQNRLVRIAELNNMLKNLAEGEGFSTTEIKADVAHHNKSALLHQNKLLKTLELFSHMRNAGDPVS
jgi:hypothetical protein